MAKSRPLFDGLADGIGRGSGKLELKDARGRVLRSENLSFASQGDALDRASQWLTELSPSEPSAIGHRVVHGGPRLVTHQRITPAVLSELKACLHFAPLHIPVAHSAHRKSRPHLPESPAICLLRHCLSQHDPGSGGAIRYSPGAI